MNEYTRYILCSPVSLFSCSPNAITGKAEAKKMYAVGANILERKKKMIIKLLVSVHWLTSESAL